jgi:leucyl-tRNA synthetase
MVWCEKCKWQPVNEEDLPVRLPEVEHYEPTDTGESPLAKMTEWVKTKCPKCGGEAKRETDTMPNWAGSDWYFLAYCLAGKLKNSNNQISSNPNNNQLPNSKFQNIFNENQESLKYWMPVDVYIGGDEHNTLHLLYSRFIVNFLYDIGAVPMSEPYFRRISHGVILGPDGQRMSKSRGNVIVPDEMVEKWGVDVVRMYLMFMGPFEATMAWNEKTLSGVKRFLGRFEKYINNQIENKSASTSESLVIINKLVAGVTKDVEGFGFNTVVAKLMEGLNQLIINNYELRIGDIKTLIKLIAPLAPYTAEELWAACVRLSRTTASQGHDLPVSVHLSEWPKVEEKYLRGEMITVPVAVNGRVREQLTVNSQQLKVESEVLKMAKELPKIKQWVGEKRIMREIYVPGKMVNLVVN